MARHRAQGINQIANALFGSTGTLASRGGFQDQASGNANIASALLNRAKAGDIQIRAGDRRRGLGIIEEGGDSGFLADALIAENPTIQGFGKRRLQGQEFVNRGDARTAIDAENFDRANVLNQIGSGKPISRFGTGKFGSFNVATGEETNPALAAGAQNLQNAQVGKNLSFRDKADAETEQILAKTRFLIKSGGRVPPTGNALADFTTKALLLFEDRRKGGRKEIPRADGTLVPYRDATQPEQNAFIIRLRRQLIEADPETQAKILAQMELQELPLTPTEGGEEGGEEGGVFDSVIDFFGFGDDEEIAAPGVPPVTPAQPPAPQIPAAPGGPLGPNKVAGSEQFQEFRNQQGIGGQLPPPLADPSLADSLAPPPAPAPAGFQETPGFLFGKTKDLIQGKTQAAVPAQPPGITGPGASTGNPALGVPTPPVNEQGNFEFLGDKIADLFTGGDTASTKSAFDDIGDLKIENELQRRFQGNLPAKRSPSGDILVSDDAGQEFNMSDVFRKLRQATEEELLAARGKVIASGGDELDNLQLMLLDMALGELRQSR